MSTYDYSPQNDHEKNYFDFLWDIANNRTPSAPGAVNLTGELSGLAAVTFFQRSGVDKGFLKQIWSLSTPVATMNVQQFYVALRFIAMIQNGEMPISKERLIATKREKFELPRFGGIDVPVARPAVAVATAPANNVTPVANPALAGTGAANSAAFAITPQEHMKYHSLFLNYDLDKDGFLSREEAVPVFRQSGLDAFMVDQIWAFSDDDRDNRLTSKEFSAAFHIIVCVSKRGQPFPPALPPSLKMFLINAPAVPGEIPPVAAPVAGFPAPALAPVAIAPVPAPAPVPVEVKKLDISSAFGAFDDSPAANPAISSSAPALAVSGADDTDIRNSLDSMKAATRKTIAAHEQAVEINGKAYSSLTGIKQRLATDRIALEATVANALTANNESNVKLEQVSQEIFQLQEQIRHLTQRLQETLQNTTSAQSRVAKAQEEKQQLLKEIDHLLKQLEVTQVDSTSLSEKLTASERESGRLEAENKALAHSSSSLRKDIATVSQENEDLRRVASSLRERAGNASSAKQNLSTRLTLSTDRTASLQATNLQLQATVKEEAKKKEAVSEERKSLLASLSPSSNSSSSPRTEEDSFAFVSSTKTVVSSTTSINLEDNDDPFGGFDTDNKLAGVDSNAGNNGFAKLEDEETSKKTSVSGFDDADPFGGFGDLGNKPSQPPVPAPISPKPKPSSDNSNDDPFASAFSGADLSDPFAGSNSNKVKAAPVMSISDPFATANTSKTDTHTADPFGGFDDAPSSTNKKEVMANDDPFAGFDDNIPTLPTKTSTTSSQPSSPMPKPLPALPTSNNSNNNIDDPFAGFDSSSNISNNKTESMAVVDPFSGSAIASSDPFSSFATDNDKSSDPFGGFDSSKVSTAMTDDAFGTSSFGDAAIGDDPFATGFTATSAMSPKKTTEEDDPFAGFD